MFSLGLPFRTINEIATVFSQLFAFYSWDSWPLILICLSQQRPPFFSFKMGLPSATTCAFTLSGVAYLFSAVLRAILPDPFKRQVTVRKYITEQIIFCIGSFAMFLCWELSHHLHRVSSSYIFFSWIFLFLFSIIYLSQVVYRSIRYHFNIDWCLYHIVANFHCNSYCL
jgi:hypothetical protein